MAPINGEWLVFSLMPPCSKIMTFTCACSCFHFTNWICTLTSIPACGSFGFGYVSGIFHRTLSYASFTFYDFSFDFGSWHYLEWDHYSLAPGPWVSLSPSFQPHSSPRPYFRMNKKHLMIRLSVSVGSLSEWGGEGLGLGWKPRKD